MGPNLIVVIGMPGAGKTTYMEQLKQSGEISVFYDDFQADAPGKDKNPFLSKHFAALVKNLRLGKTVAVADIRYCDRRELNLLLAAVISAVPEIRIDLRYFENAADKCRANVSKRARKWTEQEFEYIDEYAAVYDPSSISVQLLDITQA